MARATRPGAGTLIVLACGGVLLGAGALVLAASRIDDATLRLVSGGNLRMKANLALGLMACGAALLALEAAPGTRRRSFALAPALLALAIGSITLAEYVLDLRFSIDELLFVDRTAPPTGGWRQLAFYPYAPGRMAPYSALALSIGALALCILALGGWRRAARGLAGLGTLLGGVLVVGIAWQVADRWLPPVPIATALALLTLGVGTLAAARSDRPGPLLSRPARFGIEARVLGACAAVAALLFVGGRFVYQAGEGFAARSERVVERQEARIRLARVYAALGNAESSQRAYLLNGAPRFRDEFARYEAEARDDLRGLLELVDGDPPAQATAVRLQTLAEGRLRLLDSVALTFDQSGLDAAREALATSGGTVLMAQVRDLMDRLDVVAAREVASAQLAVTRSRRVTLLASFATLAGTVALLALVFAGVRREMIARSAAQAALVASHAQLEHARTAADQASLAKSAFLATMSHEIRTPMNGIVGMVDVLDTRGLSADQADSVQTIRRSADVLLRLIDDILDFSKIESGRIELEAVPVVLADLLADVRAGLATVAAANDVALETAVDPALPEAIVGDPTRLRQVLLNLVGNAIKFSGRRAGRRGRVQVRLEPNGDVADELRLRVVDDGVGMDADVQARLFRPFSQGEASTTRRFGGTGLGLAICGRLVELMHGRISVASAAGAGATFDVVVPMRACGEVARRAPAERLVCLERPDTSAADAPRPTIASAREEGRLFLVVEDDAVNRKVVLRQLALLGFAAEVASDGDEALALWRQNRYAGLVTDLHMPAMDGHALARAIRAGEPAGRRAPIVALTADALPSTARRAAESGIDVFLTKPTSLERLREALSRCLQANAERGEGGGATAAEIGDAAVFDRSVPAALLGTDDEATLAEFLADFDAALGRADAELAAGEAVAGDRRIGAVAHRLKSNARAMGARALADACAELENAAHAGSVETLRRQVEQARAAIAGARPAVGFELDRLRSAVAAPP